MNGPIVSVIMLTFNRERYIQEAIASVFAQTFQDLELIIIDDGSTDKTEMIISEIGNEKLFYHKLPHSGRGSALRNFGVQQSRGKFIAFIDSDDVWLPEKIQIQLGKVYANPEEPGFAFTDVIEFTNEGRILKNSIYKDLYITSDTLFSLYVENRFSIYPSTMLFDKRCLALAGKFNEDFPWTDNDFFHRLAFNYKGFLIHKPLVKIRKHDSNTSSTAGQETVNEMIHMLKNFFREGMISRTTFKKMTSHYYYLSGILYLQENNPSMARKAFVNCAQYDPFNMKAWIRGTLSFFYIH